MARVVLTKTMARNRLHPVLAGVYAYEWDIEQHKSGGPTFSPPFLTPGKNRVERKLKILVAADKPGGIAMPVSLPEDEYELLWVSDRGSLLNALRQDDFDIVLLQSQRLDSEILKVARELASYGGAVPLIVVSSPVAGWLAAKALEAKIEAGAAGTIDSRLLQNCGVRLIENTRPQKANKQKVTGIFHPGIRRALQLIHSEYSRKLSVKQIARAACMSQRHFFRTFRKAVGLCPVEYLNRVRIEMAKEKLRQQYSVVETALAVGFGSVSYFGRVFKKFEGVSPTVYRRRAMRRGNGTIVQ